MENDYKFRKMICSITGDIPIDDIGDIPRDKLDWEWFAHCVNSMIDDGRLTIDDYINLGLNKEDLRLIANGERKSRVDVMKWSKWIGGGFEWIHKDINHKRNNINS